MMFSLFKIQLMSVYRSILFKSRRKGKPSSPVRKVLYALLFVYAVGAVGTAAGTTMYVLAEQLIAVSMDYLYFAGVALISFAFSFMFTVFVSQSMLFEAKDNQLLLSLPITSGRILASRMMVLFSLEFLSSLLFLLPAGVVYVILKSPGIGFYLFFAAACVVLPLLGLTFAALFGFIISFITSRMRNKSLFVTLFSLMFLVLYMFLYTRLLSGMTTLIAHSGAIAYAIKAYLPPFYHLAIAITQGDILAFGMFLVWCTVPFLAIYWVLAKNFYKIAAASGNTRRFKYKAGKIKAAGAFKALLNKELRKFLSSPSYLLNSGISFLLNLVLGVYVFIQGSAAIAQMAGDLPGIMDYIVPALTAGLLFLSAMSLTTAPSISLEGKQLWILKSLPVSTMSILHAKLALNLVLGIPSILIAAGLIAIRIEMSAEEMLVLAAVPVSMQVFTAIAGLISNLRFPKLDSISDTVAVKQSASVMVAMLVSFGMLITVIGIYFALGYFGLPFWAIGACVFAVLSLLSLIGYRFLAKKGVWMFEQL